LESKKDNVLVAEQGYRVKPDMLVKAMSALRQLGKVLSRDRIRASSTIEEARMAHIGKGHDGEHDQLHARWRPALMSFFLRRVRDHATAEDLTQETLLRALNSEVHRDQPDAYMFRIAQNLLIDRSRRLRIRNAHLRTFEENPGRDLDPLDPERIALGREQLAKLLAALEELPERTRTIFILYRMEHMPQDAIGETFGISASAVKQQIAKAMAILARKMRNE
jgi:RNA polymerase sigma factor (sigma-70 family)